MRMRRAAASIAACDADALNPSVRYALAAKLSRESGCTRLISLPLPGSQNETSRQINANVGRGQTIG
jgi:hypothetical protein